MNAMKTAACAKSVRLMFMLASARARLAERRGERIGECEEHRDSQADDERGVDQTEEQKYLSLQRVGELRLARRRLEEAAAHDAHADARVSLHHREQLEVFHWSCSFLERVMKSSGARGPSRDTRRSAS